MFNRWFKKESPILGLLGMGGGIARAAAAGFSASGGDVDALAPGNGYTYHTFTTSGAATLDFANAEDLSIEFLIIGGGGAGSSGGRGPTGPQAGGGAGGGAGGFVNGTTTITGSGSLNVTVGAGGVPGGAYDPSNPSAFDVGNGSNSSVVFPGPVTVTAAGGGRGAYQGKPIPSNASPSYPGGSGGGCVGNQQTTTTGTQPGLNSSLPPSFSLTHNKGNAGGSNPSGTMKASGGGGAGGAGGPNDPFSPPGGSKGGDGYPIPAFTGTLIGVPGLAPLNGTFAGGGGGGGLGPPDQPNSNYNTGGNGGPGGGGHGGKHQSDPGGPLFERNSGQPGVTNSGSGGGGDRSAGSLGGNGGTGIVVVRYQAP